MSYYMHLIVPILDLKMALFISWGAFVRMIWILKLVFKQKIIHHVMKNSQTLNPNLMTLKLIVIVMGTHMMMVYVSIQLKTLFPHRKEIDHLW